MRFKNSQLSLQHDESGNEFLQYMQDITSNLHEESTTDKFNYITLFMRYYIYCCKLNNKPIVLHEFVNAVHQRDLIENTVKN